MRDDAVDFDFDGGAEAFDPLRDVQLLSGLAYITPTIGQIKIGHMSRESGKSAPRKDPYITVASMVKDRDGGWVPHPVNNQLAQDSSVVRDASGNIVGLPVRLKFDNPRLLFRERLEALDPKKGRQVCVSCGVGTVAHGSFSAGANSACPGVESCTVAAKYRCGLFGRLLVQIPGQDDSMASFIFRTRGWNSVRALRGRLAYFSALCGGHLSGLPLMLRLRAKSTPQSYGTPIFYLDLTLPHGVSEFDAIKMARAHREEELGSEYPRALIEDTMLRLLGNGDIEETEEEAAELEDWLADGGGGGSVGDKKDKDSMKLGGDDDTSGDSSVGLAHLRTALAAAANGGGLEQAEVAALAR